MNLRLIAIAAAFLTLAGCSTIGTAGKILTGGVANPLTPARALAIDNGFSGGVVVAAGLYAALPRCPAVKICSSQPVVDQMRNYIGKATALIDQLDEWALGNPAIDGPAIYSAALLAISTAETFASSQPGVQPFKSAIPAS